MTIDGVVVRNFHFFSGSYEGNRIAGDSPDHMIKNITFDNVNILGKLIQTPEEGKFIINKYTSNIKFLPAKKKKN